MLLKVKVTRHAVERLFERFPKHKKFDARVVANIFESIIKDGVVLRRGNEVRISTSKYTLCCVLNDKLVIKTVLRTEELGEYYKRAIRRGRRERWGNIIFDLDKLEKICKKVERMRDVCKICGISKEQAIIERCNIYGFYVCEYCCVSVGGYSDRCRNCPLDIYTNVKSKEDVYYIIF